MAINKDSSTFTFGFAAGMVVVVATLLAVAALALKPAQDENKKQEKMKDILKSVGVECEMKEAPELFRKYITKRIVLDVTGKVLGEESGDINPTNATDAFNVDIKKEYKQKLAGVIGEGDMHFPMYICEKEGETFYVLPMIGTGLWGPVWGNVSLQSDMNTIFGATFDHQGETPGLGAEINTPGFQQQFVGEQIFDESGSFASVKVVKGASDPADKHGVDGITGGTITSVGVDEMISRSLKIYVPYLNQLKQQKNASL